MAASPSDTWVESKLGLWLTLKLFVLSAAPRDLLEAAKESLLEDLDLL